MILLNSRSILECRNKEEYEKHFDEIDEILDSLDYLKCSNLTVFISGKNPVNGKEVLTLTRCEFDEIIDIVEFTDSSKGFDLYGDEENSLLSIISYGHGFTSDSSGDCSETVVKIYA